MNEIKPRAKIKVDRTFRCLTERRAIILQAALAVLVPDDYEVLRTRRVLWWEVDTYAPAALLDAAGWVERFGLTTSSGGKTEDE